MAGSKTQEKKKNQKHNVVELRIGETFKDSNDVEKFILKFNLHHNVKFSKGSTRSVGKARVKGLKKNLGFAEMLYKCECAGIYKSKSQGKRPGSCHSKKTNCPALIRFGVKNKKKLELRNFNMKHNHELKKSSVDALPSSSTAESGESSLEDESSEDDESQRSYHGDDTGKNNGIKSAADNMNSSEEQRDNVGDKAAKAKESKRQELEPYCQSDHTEKNTGIGLNPDDYDEDLSKPPAVPHDSSPDNIVLEPTINNHSTIHGESFTNAQDSMDVSANAFNKAFDDIMNADIILSGDLLSETGETTNGQKDQDSIIIAEASAANSTVQPPVDDLRSDDVVNQSLKIPVASTDPKVQSGVTEVIHGTEGGSCSSEVMKKKTLSPGTESGKSLDSNIKNEIRNSNNNLVDIELSRIQIKKNGKTRGAPKGTRLRVVGLPKKGKPKNESSTNSSTVDESSKTEEPVKKRETRKTIEKKQVKKSLEQLEKQKGQGIPFKLKDIEVKKTLILTWLQEEAKLPVRDYSQKKIKKSEIDHDNLPDSLLEVSDDLLIIKPLMFNNAYAQLEKAISEKKKNEDYKCQICDLKDHPLCTKVIMCDECYKWYHLSCIGLTTEPADTIDWYCNACLNHAT